MTPQKGGGGGWHKASVCDCLPLAAPIGLSPLLILTLCERGLVVSTEPPDDLSCLTTPGVGCPGDGPLGGGGLAFTPALDLTTSLRDDLRRSATAIAAAAATVAVAVHS